MGDIAISRGDGIMNRISISISIVVIGLAAAGGVLVARFTQSASPSAPSAQMSASANKTQPEIDYWVAPMDPNYRREDAGKSPMGMDLIPVYKKSMDQGDGVDNALEINPAVINNIGVAVEPVVQGYFSRPLHTVGVVTIDEEKQSDIHVRSEGWIENLIVKSEGEVVEQGDVLFQIYSPALSTAQSEYIQAIKLNRRGLIDAARTRLNALGMTQRQIEQVRQSGKPFHRVDITAPRSGTVVVHQVREGMFVKPQTLTMRLGDLTSVWVVADIFENQTTQIKRGKRVQMTAPSVPNKEWLGTVDYIYPIVEVDTRTVKVRLRFGNAAGDLKLNAFVKIEIEGVPIEDALTIPLSAVIRTSTQDRVILALGEGRFRPTQVHLGFESEGRIQILAGLTLGEKIVTSGQFLIDSEASLEPSLLRLITPKMPLSHDMMDKGASE